MTEVIQTADAPRAGRLSARWRGSDWLCLAILVLVCFVLFTPGLTTRPLSASREAKAGLTARHIIEDHDGVHTAHRRDQLGALILRHEGPTRLAEARRNVAVETDDQRIAQRTGRRQIADMADVEQVEMTVGHHDHAACLGLRLSPCERRIQCENLPHNDAPSTLTSLSCS